MTTFNQTLNLNKNAYVFNNVKTSGSIKIFDYDQLTDTDTNILTDKINIIDNIKKPEIIFDLNKLFVKKNLIIESKTQYSYVTNKGITNVKNNINISDKYKKLDIYFLGEHNNTNNLNIFNKINYHKVLKNLYVNGNKNTNYINNLISYNNTNIKSNINITNNFTNTNLNYNEINIKYNITTKNNLNIFNDIFIAEPTLQSSTIKSITINNSVSFNIFILPNIDNTSKNFKNGSIAYNPINNSIFSYLNNKPYYINKKNENGNTMINQKFPNIDFISNNKNIINFNYNTSIISIKSNNTIIKNNLNVSSYVNIKNNDYTTTITNYLFSENIIFKENRNFVISSNINYNTNVYNSSIRYNNLDKIYEKYYNNKWIPLLDISNLDKTTYLELQSINDSKNINNTIILNSNKKSIFKLNELNLLFNSYNHYLPQNSSIKKECFITNNINCESLFMNNNQSSVRLINKDNKIYYNNNSLIYLAKTSITTSNIYSYYNFYINSIKNTYKKCNTINSIISSNLFVNNQIFVENYKVYNNIIVSSIVINLNKKCNTSLLVKISDNTTEYSAQFNILGEIKDNIYIDTNIPLLANQNLYISVKSINSIENLSANIYVKCKNIDSYGLIYPTNLSLFIDKLKSFNLEDRSFYGNFNISNNLNLNSNINVDKKSFISDNLHINSNNNNLVSIKNNNNKSLFFIYPNNAIGFFTNQYLKTNTVIIDSNISIDKNTTVNRLLNINENTIISNNLNIGNTLFINNLSNSNNINLSNNLNLNITNNGTFNSNLNIINNVTVVNNINKNYIIFVDTISNYYSNIKYKNNKLKFFKNSWKNMIEYPNYNDNDNIYLEDTSNINFKYKTKNILHISKNNITTNGLIIDNNKILNISPNFYVSNNTINVDSSNFYVNNNNILNDLILLEKHYYTPYNINFSKNINLTYNISYNMPRLFKNLKTYDTNLSKNIEYISYQLCLGNINSHFHPNWNNNSIIYYKKYVNGLDFIEHSFTIPNNVQSYNTNHNFDFITTGCPTYNINIDSNDKLQYIYKNQNQTLEFLSNNNKISMRIIPIYNVRNPTYIYYSEIVNI